MLVLFDQNTPVAIAKSLPGHVVKTARQQGWDILANGELLRAAEEAGFNILLTADQNLAYQQNLKARKIAIVILGGNRWSNVKMVMSRIVTAVDSAQPGTCIVVDVERLELNSPFQSVSLRTFSVCSARKVSSFS